MQKLDKDVTTASGAKELVSALEKHGIHVELKKKLKEKLESVPKPEYAKEVITATIPGHYPENFRSDLTRVPGSIYNTEAGVKHLNYSVNSIVKANQDLKRSYEGNVERSLSESRGDLEKAKNIYNKIAKKTEGRNLNFINFESPFKQSSRDQNKIAAMHAKIGSVYTPIGSKYGRFSGKKFQYEDITNPIDLQLRHALNNRMRSK